jgi:putative MFS transporter
LTVLDLTGAAPVAPHAAERLDRLPVTRWLGKVMVVLFLGWLVESYDIGLTGSVLPSLSHIYHLSTGEKSLVATASTIGIVVGIVPAGWLADRYGRKRVLIAGTVMYALVTFATGFAGDVAEIVALRAIAGTAMGAVFPLPYAYGAELCPPTVRGRFTGVADSFLSIGYFASPLLAVFLVPTTSSAGWRTMFYIGGLPIVFALVVWRLLPESPRWFEDHGRWAESEAVLAEIERAVERELGHALPAPARGPARAGGGRTSLRDLWRGTYLRRSLVLWATFGGTFFLFYSVQTFMPTVVTSMGFGLTSAFAFTAVIVGVSIPGKYLEAWLVERWGRKPVIISFTLVAAVAALAFGLVRGAVAVLAVGGVMSLFGIGVDPAVKVYTAESYPTAVRATATATTEGFGRLLSGIIGPALVPPLLAAGGVEAAFSVVGVVALAAVVIVALWGEETRSLTLEQLAVPTSSVGPARAATDNKTNGGATADRTTADSTTAGSTTAGSATADSATNGSSGQAVIGPGTPERPSAFGSQR